MNGRQSGAVHYLDSPCLFIIIPSVSPLSLRLTFPSAWPRVLSLYRPSLAFSLSPPPSPLSFGLSGFYLLSDLIVRERLVLALLSNVYRVRLARATSYLARARMYKRSRFAVHTGDRITKRATCCPDNQDPGCAFLLYRARCCLSGSAWLFFLRRGPESLSTPATTS